MVPSGPTPVVFGPADRPLFGFYHPAEGRAVHATGVVLCNPLGYDAMCAHRTYRHLGERLAARGIAALRFDYQGTGDSSGQPDEPGRVRAWLDSLGAAIEELRSRSGVRRIGLFGVRFGATLAAVAAAERGDVENLVLWAPCASGRVYVRELRAFRLIKEQEGQKPRLDGDEEVAGYLFDRATVADISALDLLAIKARVAARALVVPRDDLPGGEARLVKHLEAVGVDVKRLEEPGYARMMRDPQETVVPFVALDAMVDWVCEGARVPGGPEEPVHADGVPRTPALEPGQDPRAPSTSTVLSFSTTAGRVVREEIVQFGDGQRLFGILTEPTEDARRRSNPPRERSALDRPAVLFLNVGANHHVGPNRMYVSMAREFAALGYVALRFDVAGLGDSRMAPGASENRLYSKDSVGDVKAAMDFLASSRKLDRFVLMGLCSGAYLAFHTAVEDPRVVGQVLLNPQTFEWKEGDSLELSIRKSFMSTRYYARAIFDPAVWAKLLRGRVNFRGIAGVLHDRFMAQAKTSAASLTAKIRGRSEPQTDVERAFCAMSDRGVESLLVFSFNDGGLDMIEKHLGRNVRKMKDRRNVHFEIVEGADHTFTPVVSQHALHDIVTRYVTGSFR